jgi:hypothetical protein
MPAKAAVAAEPLRSARREKLIFGKLPKLLVVMSRNQLRAGRRQFVCDLGRFQTLIAASGSGGNIRVQRTGCFAEP